MPTLLTTLACTIDENGISAPAFTDILYTLQSQFQGIYGSDIYIDPDSQDGQWLGFLANTVNDGNLADVATYNAYSPGTAQGAGLSSVVKINGLRRQVPSNSSAVVTLIGQAGTPINNGVVQDTSKNLWNLPTSVTIPLSGTIDVTVTAQTAGMILAPAGTITTIYTPTRGWQSVNNASAATPGAPVEQDPALKQRQANSTALPAQTPLQSIKANVAAQPGVERNQIYQNDTNTTDSNDIPGHSIAMVVEGGDIVAIAQTIEAKKAPGTGTYGTTTELVLDPAGVPINISLFAMSEIALYVQATLVPLSGYVSTTKTTLATVLATYLQGLQIGQSSLLGKLFGPANLSGDVAVSASGQTQEQLDALSNTYNLPVQNLFQGRMDMVTTESVAAGGNSVTIQNVASLANGQSILINQADGSQLQAVITDIAGDTVTFTPAVAAGKSINTGAQMLVNGDLVIAFNEGAQCSSANIVVLP